MKNNFNGFYKLCAICSGKRFLLILLSISVLVLINWRPAVSEDFLSLEYANRISAEDLSDDIDVLTADSLEGRKTGTEADLKAAYFLARKFIRYNVDKYFESYLQSYDIVLPNKPDVSISTDLNRFTVGKDFLSLFPHDSISINADEIIYAGYGIKDEKWNDYAYKDVKGKIVLVKAGEPTDHFGNKIITGLLHPSKWSADPIHSYMLKRNAAKEAGARAMLYFDPKHYKIFKEIYDHIYQSGGRKVHNIQVDSLYDFIIGTKVLQDLGYDDLDSVYYHNRRERKWKIPVRITFNTRDEILSSQNVVAYVKGAEEPDKCILVCANFDGPGKSDTIVYPGANNNASGTAAVLEMAGRFQEAAEEGYPPKYSIVFALFSGREENHLGAKYYLKHPAFPLTKTLAVVDVDQIGFVDTLSRDPNNIYLAEKLGKKNFFKELEKVNREKRGPRIILKKEMIEKKYANIQSTSDGVVFYKNHLPVVSFFNWLYPYNRTPEDTPDKITWDIYDARTKYIFLTVWKLAND